MDSSDPQTRVGDAERQAAIARLGEHWRAGRLDPAEHEARTTKAFHAVTRGDLDVLFTDLPADVPQGSAPAVGTPMPVQSAPAVGTPMPAQPAQPAQPAESPVPFEGSWLDGKRDAIMGVTPFVILIVLFATSWRFWWLWLLIPVMGTLLYGGGHGGRKRHRRRERE